MTDLLAQAREHVRRSLAMSRQIEQHAIYLNADQVEYIKDCAAQERIEARRLIAEAKRLGKEQMRAA